MEDIQPFKSSLWEFYITHHWFLHKDKDGHKEPPDWRLSLRRAAVCVFADSSKASRSCGHCCARRTPLLIPRQNTDRKQLIFFIFFYTSMGRKKKNHLFLTNVTSDVNPSGCSSLWFPEEYSSLWVQGGAVNCHRSSRWRPSYFTDASRDGSWSRHRCFHLGRVVFGLKEKEGSWYRETRPFLINFFSQVIT